MSIKLEQFPEIGVLKKFSSSSKFLPRNITLTANVVQKEHFIINPLGQLILIILSSLLTKPKPPPPPSDCHSPYQCHVKLFHYGSSISTYVNVRQSQVLTLVMNGKQNCIFQRKQTTNAIFKCLYYSRSINRFHIRYIRYAANSSGS